MYTHIWTCYIYYIYSHMCAGEFSCKLSKREVHEMYMYSLFLIHDLSLRPHRPSLMESYCTCTHNSKGHHSAIKRKRLWWIDKVGMQLTPGKMRSTAGPDCRVTCDKKNNTLKSEGTLKSTASWALGENVEEITADGRNRLSAAGLSSK